MLFRPIPTLQTFGLLVLLCCGSLTTSAETAGIETRVYDLRDLLHSSETPLPPNADDADRAAQPKPRSHDDRVKEMTDLINETLKAKLDINEIKGNLVIKGTDADHRGVLALIEKLRELRDIQVTSEAAMVVMSDQKIKELGVILDTPVPAGNPEKKAQPAAGPRFAYLDDKQVDALRRAAEAAPESAATTSLPRITLINGQRGFAIVGGPKEKSTDAASKQGLVIAVSGTASNDRRHITLTLHPTLWNPAADGKPTTLDVRTTISAPDQGTIAIDMGTLTGPLRLEGIKDAAAPDKVRRVVMLVKTSLLIAGEKTSFPGLIEKPK